MNTWWLPWFIFAGLLVSVVVFALVLFAHADKTAGPSAEVRAWKRQQARILVVGTLVTLALLTAIMLFTLGGKP